ncbi:hypothetical protein ACFYPX_09310 [Micromonospora zamorensis]|uniref:hypothetical protein n=1 Tax=Micromonospora zamorensis TaxID=709883 RepID=UPI0036AD02C3
MYLLFCRWCLSVWVAAPAVAGWWHLSVRLEDEVMKRLDRICPGLGKGSAAGVRLVKPVFVVPSRPAATVRRGSPRRAL